MPVAVADSGEGEFLCPKCPKPCERCNENAKRAEFSTFTTIKVRKSSLQFEKVVVLYKVRNFAEYFCGFLINSFLIKIL